MNHRHPFLQLWQAVKLVATAALLVLGAWVLVIGFLSLGELVG